mgnify:CR=1 FL=1
MLRFRLAAGVVVGALLLLTVMALGLGAGGGRAAAEAASAEEEGSLRATIAERMREAAAVAVATGSPTPAVDSTGMLPPLDVLNITNVNNTVTEAAETWAYLPTWAQYTAGVVFLFLGLVLTFLGGRYMSLSVFVLLGGLGALLMYLILVAAIPDSDPNKAPAVFWSALAVWVVVGTLFVFCVKFILFLMGFAAGAVLALMLNPVGLHYTISSSPAANVAFYVFLFGLILGIAAICLERPFLIIVTAFGGAFVFSSSIALMVGGLDIMYATSNAAWQPWVFLFGTLALAAVGAVVQFLYTAGELAHKEE